MKSRKKRTIKARLPTAKGSIKFANKKKLSKSDKAGRKAKYRGDNYE